MTVKFQFFKSDGRWTTGDETYDLMWADVRDELRFHRGAGFRISDGTVEGPMRTLAEVDHYLPGRMANSPVDTIFTVRSLRDDFSMRVRKHVPEVTDKGLRILAHCADLKGTPYVLGGMDCSRLAQVTHAREGVTLPRTTWEQAADKQIIRIPRAKIKPGDLKFHHNIEHVSMHLDDSRVWDTEPHDTTAPWGGMQGTGVQVRSTLPGWYCDWEHVDFVGRIVAINGKP